jgi:hypothetical protein
MAGLFDLLLLQLGGGQSLSGAFIAGERPGSKELEADGVAKADRMTGRGGG